MVFVAETLEVETPRQIAPPAPPEPAVLVASAEVPKFPWLRPLALAVALLVLLVLVLCLNVSDKVLGLKGWFAALGNWGPLAFVGIYVVADVGMVPATLLTVAAGAIFGPVIGVLCISAGATIAAAICFVISRYVAREAVARAWAWLRESDTGARNGAGKLRPEAA